MVEVSFIMVSAFFSFLLGIGAYIMYPLCKQDILIAMFIGIILTYPIFRVVKYIIKNNYYKDIFEFNKTIKGIGKILNVLLFIGLYIISLFLLYNVSDFLNIEYFSESSVGFTKFLVLIPVFYVLTKDIKSILKTNQIISIICIVILVIDFLGVMHKIDFSNIEPIFSTSTKDFIKSLINFAVLNGTGVTMCALVGRKDVKGEDKQIDKILDVFYNISNIIQIIIIGSVVLTQGIDYVLLFRFPEYIALKQFSFLIIFERIENLLALQFYFNTISFLSFLIHYIVKLIPKNEKIKIYPFFVLLTMYYLTGLLFKNTIFFITYIRKFIIPIAFLTIILPIFIDYIILHKKVNKNTFKCCKNS